MLLKILIVLAWTNIIGSVPVSKIAAGIADNPFKNTGDVYSLDVGKVSSTGAVETPSTPGNTHHRKHEIHHTKHHNHIHSVHFDSEMQGDQPMNDDGFKRISVMPIHEDMYKSTSENPMATADPKTMEARLQQKNKTQEFIKAMTLLSTGRTVLIEANQTESDSSYPPDDDQKLISSIRPYFPECGILKRVKDNWKDDNMLHMYYNVSHGKNVTVASAIIRLHRTPITTQTRDGDNNNVRVSVFYYAKKSNTISKFISDSKVVSLKNEWVELDIKPALEAWKSHNLGLSVMVEGIDQVPLKASNFFIGRMCTDGAASTTTPKPIPNIVLDEAYHVNDIQRLLQSRGITFTGKKVTIPTINICVVQDIYGHPIPPGKPITCPAQMSFHNIVSFENRLTTGGPSIHTTRPRHVRHPKHHIQTGHRMQTLDSLRASITNSTIMCPDGVCDLQALVDKLNSTIIR